MESKIKAKAIVFGNNIDTDVILPGKYLILVDPYDLGKHALGRLRHEFVDKAKGGIIIIGGKNFGCGSSREQAPLALKYSGVKCVIAESFARIFYRNSINIGLPVIECKGISRRRQRRRRNLSRFRSRQNPKPNHQTNLAGNKAATLHHGNPNRRRIN